MAQPCWHCGAPPAPIAAPSLFDQPNTGSSRLLPGDKGPLGSATPFWRDSLSAAQNEVDNLDFAIQHVRETLDQLLGRREEAVEVVGRLRAIIAPIRCMPAELLYEVFSWLGAGDSRTPWRLAGVCQSWRALAVTYGPLWSAITLPSLLAPDYTLLKLETQLCRSGNAALDIRFEEHTGVFKMVQMVVEQCHRWRSLHLTLFGSSVYELGALWHRTDTSSFPRLETLEIVDRYHATTIPDVFALAPLLRRVILTDKDFRYASAPLVLPWRQITHYRGFYLLERHIEILTAASNLQECSICYGKPDEIPFNNSIALPHLRRLRTNNLDILRHLSAPVLEDLVLSRAELSQETLLPVVGLKRLTLLTCYNTEVLISIILNLPVLEYLFVATGRLPTPAALFNGLAIKDPASPPCPSLTSIVHGYGGNFAPKAFFAMARSRSQLGGPGRLRFLRLYKDDAMNFTISEEIRTATEMLHAPGCDAAYLRYNDPWIEKAKTDYF
ncbi:hypothetical protein DFH06DRAFT_505587 [Mycena polygramma]|nr:hypothetical protein DFH06DRAFT_505587 [Mycena polygramma]